MTGRRTGGGVPSTQRARLAGRPVGGRGGGPGREASDHPPQWGPRARRTSLRVAGRRGRAQGAREAAVGPKSAVGHEPVQVRMPVGPRAVRLQTGDDADRELALTRQRANSDHVDGLQAVQMVRHQPKERRGLRASGLVDAACRRCPIRHTRSEGRERRAYARPGRCWLPSDCARGSSDATSTGRRHNIACC